MLHHAAQTLLVALAALTLAACQPAAAPSAAAPPQPPNPGGSTAAAPAPPATAGGSPAGAASAAAPSGAGGAGAAPVSFEIGHLPPAAFQWPSYVAFDKGFYTAQGVTPEVVQIGTPNDAARAAVSGSVALAHFSVDAAVRAIEGGGDLVVVGSEIANPAFSLIVQPDVRDYADLKGKSIAVSTPKDGAAVVLRLMLRAKGIAPDDVDYASVGTTPNRYTALKTRAAEGAIMTQPLDFVAIDEGFRLLGRSTEVLPHFMFMSISPNRTWAREHRDALVRYLRGLGAAVDWLYDPANKDEAIDILARRTNTERSAVARTYAVYIEEGKVVPRHAAVPVEGLQEYLNAMIELGDLPGPTADPARYIDLSYTEAAERT
ncbi:MAG TPA: ABC transporter substrate-binding protein [Chloroflexota bacterium]|nr:ABC transporter substrate-binding protein [Chloroflexota bacterium]